MKRRSFTLFIALLVSSSVGASLAHANSGGLAVLPGSQLWLEGKSTLHSFESKASVLTCAFEQDSTRWTGDAKAGDAVMTFIRSKGIGSIEVVVGVTGLHSGKDGLDRNMYKTLHADKYPEARFRTASYEIAEGDSGQMTVNAKGTLRVAGVERDVDAIVAVRSDGGSVHMIGAVPLLMTRFGIKPPSMMLGTIKTADQIMVHFDLVVGPKGSTAATTNVE